MFNFTNIQKLNISQSMPSLCFMSFRIGQRSITERHSKPCEGIYASDVLRASMDTTVRVSPRSRRTAAALVAHGRAPMQAMPPVALAA